MGRSIRFFSSPECPNWLWDPPNPFVSGQQVFFQGYTCWHLRLSTCHLVPRLRMSGATLSCPLYTPSWHMERKAYSLPYLFSLPPTSINTPDSTPLLCSSQHYGISGFHSTDILLTDNLPTSGSGSQNFTLSHQFATQSQLVYPGPSGTHGYKPTGPTLTFMSPHTSVYACIIHPDLHVAVSSWTIDPEGVALLSFKMLGTIT